MEKKVLVAVDDSPYSEDAVRYVAKTSSAVREMTYTLLHVQALVPHILADVKKGHPALDSEIQGFIRKNTEGVKAALQKLKDLMAREGVAQDRIRLAAQTMQEGMAKDIIDTARQGQYEAIALGRQALTPRRDFFIGTIAAKVVEHALNIPVWIVGQGNTVMEFMLAVDGSENSQRCVDHLIRAVGPNPNFKLTLFHVVPWLRHYFSLEFEKENSNLQEFLHTEDKRRMEKFYEEACRKMKASGIVENQIQIKTENHSYDISTAILGEARSGKYATIILGRRGERDAFFTGQIAMRLVQKVTDQVLWIVP
jgi:nucleotide-binding universal stress UspA family protein